MKVLSIDRSKEWTVEDFQQLEESVTPCELINGELVMSPAPTSLHQIVVGNLYYHLRTWSIKAGGLVLMSPIDLYIDNKNVFQPDVLYVSEQNEKIITERGVEGIPDLIVEVISPSNIFTDRNRKKNKYLSIGVPEFWIVDPGNKTLEVYTPETGGETPKIYLAEEGQVTSSVLTGLEFDLQILFHRRNRL